MSDGGSLYLKVLPSVDKAWEYRFKRGGTIRAYLIRAKPEMGIAAARAERDRLEHRMRTTGIDRLAAKGQAVADAKLENERKRAEAAPILAGREQQRAEERAAKFDAAPNSARRN